MKRKSFKLFASLALTLAVCLAASAIGTTSNVKAQLKFRGAHSVRTEQSSQLKSANHQVSAPLSATKKVSRVAPKDVAFPNLIGSVVQSEQGLNVGMYSITPNGLTPIKTNYQMNAANGGAALDGQYICCFMDQYMGEVYGAYYRVYDMSNWALVKQNFNADFNLMSECMTSDGSDIYGCFYKNDLSGYELGTMTLTPNPQRTGTICSLSKPYIALACDAQNLYGLYGDGKLVKISKQTGAETELAQTGIVSNYLSSAAFDSKTKTLYYANCTDTETGLYSIDFNNNYAVAKVCDLKGEVCGMHLIAPLAEDAAPAAVTDFKAVFGANGSLSGTATFTMPTKTFAGEELTGELDYKVVASGAEYATGKANAGASVTVPVEVAKAGKYKFTVVTTNAVGDSPASNAATLWVGPDEPYAPGYVDIAYADGKFNVSWPAVKTSKNKGYFDASQVTYTVTRYINNVKDAVVAEGISATSFDDEVAEPEALSIFTYEVVASFAGTASEGTKSNAVTLGNIVPPYKNEFNVAADMEAFTITGNGAQWYYADAGEAVSGYDMWNDMDTWMITKAVKLEAGKAYSFSVDVHGEDYYTDIFEVKMGTGNTAEAMTTQLVEPTTLTDAIYRAYRSEIKVETTGVYYIGVHCLSAKNMGGVHVDNFTIGAPVTTAAPGAVENVKFTAQYDGSTAIDVSFNAPTKTIAGDALTSLTKVEVFRDGNLVKTFDGIQPGAACSFKDDCENTVGTYHYVIVATNNDGAGMPYEADAYAGLKLPAAPQVCNVVESNDVFGQVTVSWTPLNTDVDGDPIDPSLITYTVLDVDQNIIAEGLTAEDAKGWKTSVDVYEGEQKWAIYYIFAKNRIGLSPTNGWTQMIPVGTAYTVPFRESAPEANLNTIWMKEGEGFWMTAQSCYQPVCMPQDNDGGMFYMEPFLAKDNNLFLSGKIQLTESDNLALSFYYCGSAEDIFDLKPVVRIPSGETYYIGEPIHANSVGTGWQRVFVSLADFKGQVVQVGLNVNNRSKQEYFLMDNVEVREFAEKDVAVIDFVAPTTVAAGGNAKMNAVVTNQGSKVAENVAVELYAGDEVIETVNVESIAVGENKKVEFNVHVDVQAEGRISYKVKAVYDGDAVTENNTSAVKTVEVVPSTLPTVTIEGETDGSTVTLTWNAPKSEGQEETVTEDFEKCESFAIGKAGDFTFYDLDGSITFGLDEGTFPGSGSAMSYIVFDSEQQSAVPAHSGNKCLASFASTATANDDWVITPQLSGKAQTISFWCRSFKTRFGYDQFEVLVSSTGTEVSDFTRLGDVRAATGVYAKEVVNVPEGTKYVAIRCISLQLDAFLIDDITFTKGAPAYEVLGYNIYRNGEKINDELVTSTQYVDEVMGRAAGYEYNVTAVYAEGESAFSNTYVMETPTGINAVKVGTNGVSKTIKNGQVIIIKGDKKFNILGQPVK